MPCALVHWNCRLILIVINCDRIEFVMRSSSEPNIIHLIGSSRTIIYHFGGMAGRIGRSGGGGDGGTNEANDRILVLFS